jgi:hypothetical protein
MVEQEKLATDEAQQEPQIVWGFMLHYDEYHKVWGFFQTSSDTQPLEGETFYPSFEDFPQEVKDWFAAHQV